MFQGRGRSEGQVSGTVWGGGGSQCWGCCREGSVGLTSKPVLGGGVVSGPTLASCCLLLSGHRDH